MSTPAVPRLGLRANAAQITLLVVINAFVGAMVGMERSILPAVAVHDFHLAARAAVLSFIVVFGVSKALTNYLAGRFSDAFGRRGVLIAGWLVATPVPLLLMWSPRWSGVLLANALLGVSQGLTWSTTVIMKIDLAGPRRRGLVVGLNEFAGYVAVAGAALATGYLASRHGLRPAPFLLGVGFAAVGLVLSVALVRETRHHAAHEGALAAPQPRDGVDGGGDPGAIPGPWAVFLRTSFSDRRLSAASQAGLVNNLNDGMAWGLFPLVFAAAGLDLVHIGWLAALYPAVWGVGQLFTGALSDRVGRKGPIVAGLLLQSAGIGAVALGHGFAGFAAGAVVLGAGTALVYPTLIAAVGDGAHPGWRASALGVYRLWRDLGYAVGAVVAGVAADLVGAAGALWLVAGITAASGLVVAMRMTPPTPTPGR